jgi:hypothetical protein
MIFSALSDFRIGTYLDLLSELSSYPLVVTCSQVVPFLLDAFFSEVQSKADPHMLMVLVPAMLERLKLVYKVPGYQEAICGYVDRDMFLCYGKEEKNWNTLEHGLSTF